MKAVDRAERIKYLREARGIGLNEAKKFVEKEELILSINQAGDLDEIKSILRTIVQKYLP